MTEKTGVSFDQVSSALLDMIANGVKPTVRKVMAVTGGKTETVSGLVRDFFDKRDADVSKMADELGSSAIAELLASEIHNVVERKNKTFAEIIERQKAQIAEMVELLDEKESECIHRIELAEAKSTQAINDANDKAKAATNRIETAETARELAEQKLLKVETETKAEVEAAKNKAETLIEAEKKEADALVKAATIQIDKAQSETDSLRAQVKDLTIDQAKHEIEQAQFEQTKDILNKQQAEIADQKTLIVQLQTEKNAFVKDTTRLESDLENAKVTSENLSQAKTQLVEMQKQLSQTQTDLSQSERERESLSQALAASK